jgi:exosortase/archaeosortase family protein
VFRLPDQELLVAEASGGVYSPILLIAVSLILAVMLRRSLLHAMLLVSASLFLVATLNTTRVFLIVLAAAKWGVDLSGGWQHVVLGYLSVAIGLLLLFSTDQLLRGLLAPVLDRHAAEFMDPEVHGIPPAIDPLSRVWNCLVARYQQPPAKPDSH